MLALLQPKTVTLVAFGILQNRRQHLSLSAPPLKSTLSPSAQTRATFNIVLNTKCTFFQKIYAEFCSELFNKYCTQIAKLKKYKSIWNVCWNVCWKMNTKVLYSCWGCESKFKLPLCYNQNIHQISISLQATSIKCYFSYQNIVN